MWLLLLVLLAAAFVAYRSATSATTTTVVLVRHAEKELVTIDDPPLSAAGERRAERLAQIFGDVRGVGRIDGLYVTATRRTQQTAMPLAARLGVKPEVVPAGGDLEALVSSALREHRGGRVLIIGHTSTIPELIEKLSGQTVPAIGEDEYDNIYVITVPTFGRSNVLRLKY
jgi:broad specificity phosphatase PhoE